MDNLQQKHLTAEQVERVEAAMKRLSHNPFCAAVTKSLAGKKPDEKRRIVAGCFAHGFEMLQAMGTAAGVIEPEGEKGADNGQK